MKLVLLTHEYPFGKGESFVANELEFYSGQGIEILVVPFKKSGTKRQLPAGVVLYESGSEKNETWFSILLSASTQGWFWKELLRFGRLFFFRSVRTAFLFFLKVAVTQQKRLNKLHSSDTIKPDDILYSYWLGGLTAGAILYNRQRSAALKVITRAHRGDVYSDQYQPDYLPFRDWVLENTDLVAVVSQHGVSYLQKQYPHHSKKIQCYYLGTFNPHFICNPSRDGVFRIVSCSYMKPVKRIHLLIESLVAFQKQHPTITVEWTHLGGGAQWDSILKMSKELSGKINCVFPGDVTQEQIFAFYREHPVDLFVNVSASEGLPVSIMEAMSTGIPVLATDVGGVRELVDESCGMLLPVDVSPAEISRVLFSFVQQPQSGLRINAHLKWQRSFDFEKNQQQFIRDVRSDHQNEQVKLPR